MAAADEYSAVFDAAEQGWRDALAAIPKMPVVLGVGVIVELAPRIVRLGPGVITNPSPDQLFWLQLHLYLVAVLTAVVGSFLLTPVASAIHRFVLLDEVTRRYSVALSRRFWRFFLFSLVFQALFAVPILLSWVLHKVTPLHWIAVSAILYGLMAVAAVIALRFLILFPAIAVEAPGAGWRNAMADTAGHTWRVFFVMLVAAIPIVGLQSALPDFQSYASLHLDSWVNKIWCFVLNEKDCWTVPNIVRSLSLATAVDWVFSVAYAAIEIFALCAFAAVASRLYAAFANRLNAAGNAS